MTQGAPRAETYAHCLLNNILVCCVAEEKSLASKALEESTNFISELDHPTTPLLQPEFAQLSLRLETEICHQIAYKGEKRLLTGIADYTLWYDDQSKYGTNLLVVEAKRPGAIYDAENQVLGYMGELHVPYILTVELMAYEGAVHEIRRMEGRRNAVVYGITTDGDMFRFWCVDNDSVVPMHLHPDCFGDILILPFTKVTSSHAYEWSRGQKDAITSFMRYIVRAAIASSPTTTRLKDSTKREVGLLVFRDAHSKESFDYGVGESLEGYPADFSDEMEIVDPPNLHTHSEHS